MLPKYLLIIDAIARAEPDQSIYNSSENSSSAS